VACITQEFMIDLDNPDWYWEYYQKWAEPIILEVLKEAYEKEFPN
jgi:hypothetical protein